MGKKIKKIKVPTASTPAGEDLEVYDIDAVHSVGKINGTPIEGNTDFVVADTPITASEITGLFNN